MAIGRVAGPMLLSTLDRQGTDLSFVTDPGTGTQTLVYLDFTNFRMGINTSSLTESLTVAGNISVGNYIKTSTTNQHLYLVPNGTGQVIVSNVNILKGNINSVDIGSTIAGSGKFTTANTSSKATFATAQVSNLTPGRIVFSDGTGLTDNSNLLYFTGNNTFYATTIESGGSVGYVNLSITGELKYPTYGIDTYVPYFAANGMFVASPGIRYFGGNATLRANNVQIGTQLSNRVLYTNSSNAVVGSAGLTYDGLNLTATGITTLSGLQFTNQTISGNGLDQNILIIPNGNGAVSVQSHKISDVADPTVDGDAVNKKYVDDRVQVSNASRIFYGDSQVIVNDDGFNPANVSVSVNGGVVAQFTDTYSYINDFSIYNNIIGTTAGDFTIIPASGLGSQNRIRLQTTTSAVLPTGPTIDRPDIPEIGDFRYNTNIGSIEWYTGAEWDSANPAVTVASQVLYPSGATNDFTLDQAATTETILVSINGTIQQPSNSYYVSGTNLHMVETPLSTDTIEVRFLAGAIVYAANPIFVNDSYTAISTSSSIMDSFYVTQYRSASYEFTQKNAISGQYQMGQLHIIHNGITANVAVTMKSTVGSTAWLVNWGYSIDGFGVLRLTATDPGSSGIYAERITSTSSDSYLIQTITASIGQTYTFSVYVRADNTSITAIKIGVMQGPTYSGGSYTNNTTATLTSDWVRYTYTFVASVTNPSVVIGGGASFGVGQNLLVWGAQVNTGASALAYAATTSSTVANNLLKYSAQIGTSPWSVSNTTVANNVEVDPTVGVIYAKIHRLYFNDV